MTTHDHDRGLAHDMRLLTRRRALFTFGAAGAAALAACSTKTDEAATTSATSTATECSTAAPEETAGPYPGDGSNGPNVLIESGIVRQDIRSSFGAYTGTAAGVPTTISLTLCDLTKSCAVGTGLAVYVWHCDRDGEYALYGRNTTNQNYLRGVQVADANGSVSFSSIFPACYSGRWPHVHFEVFDSLESAVAGDNARLTSQIAIPQDACEKVFAYDTGYSNSVRNLSQVTLQSDNVFGDGWDAELATVSGDPATSMTVALALGVGEKSTNSQPGGPQGPPPRR